MAAVAPLRLPRTHPPPPLSADADDEEEVAVELQPISSDYGQELKDPQAVEPEKFMFNSPEGAQDGVVLGDHREGDPSTRRSTRLRKRSCA